MCSTEFSASFVSGNEKVFHVKQNSKFDVVVIGGGHAGCEASLAAARMGCSTLLLTMNPLKSAEMSCNPSIGGVGKGQLVKEIDALGGEMGKNADYTGIQFKRLNTRKGSAVQSSRCQSDKKQYALRMQGVLAEQKGLSIVEAEAKRLIIENGTVVGIELRDKAGDSHEITTSAVVITAGTFMRGLMHCGPGTSDGGRFGEPASFGLSESLAQLGFTISRLKTGTPPRLIESSIDFSQMERQPGDETPKLFSFSSTEIRLPQVPCFLTYTNPETHAVIRKNLDRSPLFSGQIKGVGPRYCPSIEDKIVKFPDKPRHSLFFEPESLDSNWIYPNGISTSLPPEVQEAFLRTVPGCEKVVFARHGYAVEYDCIDPKQLTAGLEARHLGGLFLAGQVNGTSGYEEAAAQGLIAGMNAALKVQGRPSFHLARTESYIGVMIDDLIHMGVNEPYRMFTSRAEYRLSLREDNADLRLREYGYRAGLLPESEYRRFEERKKAIAEMSVFLRSTFVKPSEEVQKKVVAAGSAPVATNQSLAQLLRRPELSLSEVLTLTDKAAPRLDADSLETVEIETKYEGYIDIQRQELERLKKMQELDIPEAMDFAEVAGLSFEVKDKLTRARPKTLGQAASVSGVTPAALTALLFHLRQKGKPSAHPSPRI